MNREIKIGGMYHHFKGFIAKVITVAKHTEQARALSCMNVVGKLSTVITRTVYMPDQLICFCQRQTIQKYPDVGQKYRFELIEGREDNAPN